MVSRVSSRSPRALDLEARRIDICNPHFFCFQRRAPTSRAATDLLGACALCSPVSLLPTAGWLASAGLAVNGRRIVPSIASSAEPLTPRRLPGLQCP